MKNFLLAGMLWVLSGFGLNAVAGNILGAQLNYQGISPNSYVVNLTLIRECDNQSVPNSFPLRVNSPGCSNQVRTVMLNRAGPPATVLPYCPNMPLTCVPNGPSGPQEIRYSAVLTFTSAELACPNWYLAADLQGEQLSATANVAGTPALIVEAYLRLGAGVNNNSPQFNPLNIPFAWVQVHRNSQLSLSVYEVDGDSLAYTLIAPKQPSGLPVSYQPGRSFRDPLPSQPALRLDSLTGNIRFKATTFTPNILPSLGNNRYLVALQVNEFRKINGSTSQVGSIQRHVVVQVEDTVGLANNLPQFVNFQLNGSPLNPNANLVLPAGQSIQVTFDTFDADTADALRIFMNPGRPNTAQINFLGQMGRPSAQLSWTPTVSEIDSIPYFFEFRAEDNACPVKGLAKFRIAIKVVSPLGTRKEQVPAAGFSVFPNPFSHEVSFKLGPAVGNQLLVIYNNLGQEIDRLEVNGRENCEKTMRWEKAGKFAAGLYVAKLIGAGQQVQTLKFTKLP